MAAVIAAQFFIIWIAFAFGYNYCQNRIIDSVEKIIVTVAMAEALRRTVGDKLLFTRPAFVMDDGLRERIGIHIAVPTRSYFTFCSLSSHHCSTGLGSLCFFAMAGPSTCRDCWLLFRHQSSARSLQELTSTRRTFPSRTESCRSPRHRHWAHR